MNKIVHYIGLDVHKETSVVSIAPQSSTEVRRSGIIGGALDAVDKPLKKTHPPKRQTVLCLRSRALLLCPLTASAPTRPPSSPDPTADAPALAAPPLRSPGPRLRARTRKPNRSKSILECIAELASSSMDQARPVAGVRLQTGVPTGRCLQP